MSQPVEIYRFTQGLETLGFTTANVPFVWQGVEYDPVPMERSSVSVTDDIYKSSLTLTFGRTVDFALDMLNYSNELPYQVAVFRGELGSSTWTLNWSGRAISAKANGDYIDIECESLYTTIVRPGLRARYSKSCRHELCDQGCKLNYNGLLVPGVIQSIDSQVNLTIPQAAGYPNGYFTAGILDAGGAGPRFILEHRGSLIRINRPADIAASREINMLPGCDHLRTTCQDKFNNQINFGGFSWIPDVNPFGGGRIQ